MDAFSLFKNFLALQRGQKPATESVPESMVLMLADTEVKLQLNRQLTWNQLRDHAKDIAKQHLDWSVEKLAKYMQLWMAGKTPDTAVAEVLGSKRASSSAGSAERVTPVKGVSSAGPASKRRAEVPVTLNASRKAARANNASEDESQSLVPASSIGNFEQYMEQYKQDIVNAMDKKLQDNMMQIARQANDFDSEDERAKN